MYKVVLLPVGVVLPETKLLWLSYSGKFFIANNIDELKCLGDNIFNVVEK